MNYFFISNCEYFLAAIIGTIVWYNQYEAFDLRYQNILNLDFFQLFTQAYPEVVEEFHMNEAMKLSKKTSKPIGYSSLLILTRLSIFQGKP